MDVDVDEDALLLLSVLLGVFVCAALLSLTFVGASFLALYFSEFRLPAGAAEAIARAAQVDKGDTVYDLGCADGRFALHAARVGALAFGAESSFLGFCIARVRARLGRGRARVWWMDPLDCNVSDADVVLVRCAGGDGTRLQAKLVAEMAAGAVVLSWRRELRGWREQRHDGPRDLFKYVIGDHTPPPRGVA